jgi:D-glycero-alpha-D-manno-heptose-7-phosphate kinase
VIISRTPYRISFFGGGTDYPDWYLKNGGAVLATSIDKYCYLSCRYLPPFFPHRIRVVYSNIELCKDVSEVQHPAVREVLNYLAIKTGGLEIHHEGDLPARSGIGSSSSFTVGLLNALYALEGKMASKHQLAMESIHVEQNLIKELVGSQDQTSAAYGGLNHIKFLPNGEIVVRPITLTHERFQELNSHLMLFFTGVKRTAEKVARSYVPNIEQRKKQLLLMEKMVDEAVAILNDKNRDICEFGKLLHETWIQKRCLSHLVSNSHVDELYETARACGAVGGKLLGAGGGGFIMLFVRPELQQKMKVKLNKFLYVPFNFEFNGSQIIFFDQQQRYYYEEKMHSQNNISPDIELKHLLKKLNG